MSIPTFTVMFILQAGTQEQVYGLHSFINHYLTIVLNNFPFTSLTHTLVEVSVLLATGGQDEREIEPVIR